jgi:hypothetical protein
VTIVLIRAGHLVNVYTEQPRETKKQVKDSAGLDRSAEGAADNSKDMEMG